MSDYLSLLSITVSILAVITALIALYFTWRIPHQIMLNQRYADLLNEYRSIEMGDAIFSIFDFFVTECHSDVNLIEDEYEKRYRKEVKEVLRGDRYDPHKTLHFKRRLVDHFFWLLADLRYNPHYPIKFSARRIRQYFSENERRLLHIVYRMNRASKGIELNARRIDQYDFPSPDKSDNSPMEKYRRKLYEEAKKWK
jgi:hypothetical protein